MTGYNEYLDFAHVMGIKTFSGSIRLENTIDSVAELFLNWAAALSLPEGNYTFSAELLYYQDKGCLEEPQKISAVKTIHIIRYWLKYPTYKTQEYKIATIDLPITVIPNEFEQTFYSNPHYAILPFEEYQDPIP